MRRTQTASGRTFLVRRLRARGRVLRRDSRPPVSCVRLLDFAPGAAAPTLPWPTGHRGEPDALALDTRETPAAPALARGSSRLPAATPPHTPTHRRAIGLKALNCKASTQNTTVRVTVARPALLRWGLEGADPGPVTRKAKGTDNDMHFSYNAYVTRMMSHGFGGVPACCGGFGG